jgi:hypothetical protein
MTFMQDNVDLILAADEAALPVKQHTVLRQGAKQGVGEWWTLL